LGEALQVEPLSPATVAPVDISVVVPVFNESANIPELLTRLSAVLNGLGRSFEVVIVDDGSRDSSWRVLTAESADYPWLVGLRLSRNFGHQHALLAGLTVARGAAVVSMDGDLQHPPEVLPLLVARWDAGDKVVYTRRINDKRLGWFKRLSSRLYYVLFSWLSGVNIEAGSSDFRLLARQPLDQLLRFNDVDLFLRGAVQWIGFDDASSTVEFSVGDRHSGHSKYSLRRMLRLASSGIVSFSRKPLLVGIWLGILTSFLAFLELTYILYSYLRGATVPGWASTAGIISFLFGVLFAILGVIGLYLASIHSALQGRPRFIVAEVTGNRAAVTPK